MFTERRLLLTGWWPLGAVWFVFVCGSGAAEQPPESGLPYLTRGELIRQYDRDRDGVLSGEERQVMVRDVVEGRANVPPQVRESFRRGAPRGGGIAAQPPRAEAPRAAADGVEIQRDLVYGDAGGRPLKLDLILPTAASDKPLPLIVFIHGGGWRNGDKAGGVNRLRPLVASGHYAGASVGYRLSGEAIWPAQIHDCKAAIRWLRANANKYHIDPQRIGVWGTSAGGHLTNMLGTSGDVAELEGDCGSAGQSSRIACAVPFCGPTNFLAPKRFESGREPTAVDLLLGGPIPQRQELARQASPLTYVSADDPPFLIVHGTADGTVPFEQAEMLHEALQKAGADVTFIKLLGGGHGIGGDEVLERVRVFFDKHLRGQDVEVSAEPIQVGAP